MRKFLSLAALLILPSAVFAQYEFVSLKPVDTDQSFGLAIEGTTQTGYFSDSSGPLAKAFCWQGSTFMDLDPLSSYFFSQATGVSGSSIVGFGQLSSDPHALLWTITGPTTFSVIDIHPATATASVALAISGTQKVGWAGVDSLTGRRAGLWGADNVFVGLMPGFESVALCTTGTIQGGWTMATGPAHATIWTSAPGGTDIHPAGYEKSQVSATNGTAHGGWASLPGEILHAYYWGTGGPVDLHPAAFTSSEIRGMNATKQVGFAVDGTGGSHAMVWSGTAGSEIELTMPLGYSNAQAHGIDSAGNIVGQAQNDTTGFTEAVMWKPILDYTFIGFLNPINDPAVPESVFKKNKTVPLKFKLQDSLGANVPNVVAVVSLLMLGSVDTVVNEQDFIHPSDVGVTFSYDALTQTYSYNLDTKNLQAGKRYRVTATLANGQTHSVTFSLR